MQMKHYIKCAITILFAYVFLMVCLTGCGKQDVSKYGKQDNWAYLEKEDKDKAADVFFVCPTVFFGEENAYNMELTDEDTKKKFLGATNMEKGIYDDTCRFFAPYYRQAGLSVYELDSKEEQEKYFKLAYSDVKDSFEYYLKNYNEGRPIVLAGFSQGADMCIRLMKDEFEQKEIQDLLVACYAIGWRITKEEVEEYPQLRMAEGEDDIGVIISYNSEAESITDSMMVPKEVKTLSINPLNWKVDGTVANKSQNQGACFTGYSGEIKSEVKGLTGAYIDDVRGTLKITDLNAEDYPPVLEMFESGIYHLYDYQFFYRNLQDNVICRVKSYKADKK